MSWKEIELGLAIRVKHGFAFKGEHFSDSGNFVVLTPGNFHEQGGFRIRPDKDRYYVGEIPESFVLQESDVIVAMTEQAEGLLGSSAWIPTPGKYLHNQRLGLVEIIKPKALNKRFLYHLFNTRAVRAQISASASGTKVRHTAPERIYRVKATVPDMQTQERIAETVDNYDALIENNHRRIELVEQSARLLYKEWFVHLCFPGHEHGKVVDGVPKGWQKVSASEVIAINPSEKLEKGREAWYVPMSSLSEAGMTVDRSQFERRETHTSIKFRNGDVLLARITPCLENGKTAYVHFLDDGEVACGSTEFIVLRGRKVSQYFVYCLARTHDFRGNAIKSLIGSSGRQRVQTSCFDDFFFGLPPAVLQEQFDEIVVDSFNQIRVLESQNERLRKARDLLLPRLMSGEIEV